MRLTGITIFTDDVEKQTIFYKELFNMAPLETTNMSSLFVINGFRYFIHKNHLPKHNYPPSEDHYEFEVDNLDQTIDLMKAQGLIIELMPQDYYWGRSAYLRDDDGRLIEIHDPVKTD